MARESRWIVVVSAAAVLHLSGCGGRDPEERASSPPSPVRAGGDRTLDVPEAAPAPPDSAVGPPEAVELRVDTPSPLGFPKASDASRPLRGAASDVVLVRVCARRDPGRSEREPAAGFRPIEDLSYPRLKDAAARTSLTFRVPAFAEVPAEEGWVSVDGAGEIVALALAEQLSAMMLDAFADVSGDPAAPVAARLEELRKLGTWVTVAGKAGFWIRHGKRGEGHETVASLSVDVYFTGVDLHGATTLLGPQDEVEGRLLVAIRGHEIETETNPSLEQALKADRKVAEAVLSKVVRKVLENPRVEPALVNFVTGVSPGAPEPAGEKPSGGAAPGA